MYRKLLPLVKRFVFVRQGAFNRYYEGKLVAVDTESLQIQSYRKDGSEEEVWTIALETITEFSTGGRHLAELEFKVAYLFCDELPGSNTHPEVHLLEGATPPLQLEGVSESAATDIHPDELES